MIETIKQHQDVVSIFATAIVAAVFREVERRHLKRKHRKQIEKIKSDIA